ncbi:MAG: hypothetical protein U5S82_11675 [Gammaproteobacteria bacterium]|nr:hypothetical protein [Gammaproteobacteria bacterium]
MPRERLSASRPAILTAVVVFLAGCAAIAPDHLEGDSRYAIPAGSTLMLNEAIELPGRGDLLYLQHGRTLRFSSVQEVYPHCYIETRQRPEGPLRVVPTTFTITEVGRSFHFSWLPPGGPGGIMPTSGGGSGGDGGSALSQWFYVTRMSLRPAEPSVDVYRLTCLADRLDASGPETERHHLTVAQIRETLGDIFTLEIK